MSTRRNAQKRSESDADKLTREQVDALWQSYCLDGAPHLREQLIMHYQPWLAHVARAVATKTPASTDDLMSYGQLGLMEALEKFDPSRGFKFESYADLRVRGAMIDGLRDESWSPRLVQASIKARREALEELGNLLGRTPTNSELADHLGWSVEQLADLDADKHRMNVRSLDAILSNDPDSAGLSLAETMPDNSLGDPTFGIGLAETVQIMADRVSTDLSEHEKIVLALIYVEGLPRSEVAPLLGVTISRISQILSKANATMAQNLGNRLGLAA